MDSISQPISLSARPKKSRGKLAPYRNPFNDNDDEDQEIYGSYNNLWNTLQKKFEDVKVNLSKKFVDDITDKIKSYKYSGESILTLALLTGVNVSDHDDLFHLIRQEIKSSTSYPIVFVRSCHDISVKPVIERLVQSFLAGTETGVQDRIEDGYDSSDDDQKSLKKIKKSMCSLSRLHLWHKSRGKDEKDRTPLIIIIPDVESFCSRVLNDFFNILSVYENRIPFIIILGIATDLNALPQRGILQNLELCIFKAQPSLKFLDLVLEKIFLTADCPFQLHGKILDKLIDMFTYYNFSIEFFIRGIRFCAINHFLKSKYNVLCCSIDQLPEAVKSLSSDQFDSLLKLPSVCKYNTERRRKKLIPVNRKNIETELEALMKNLHKQLSRFHTAIRCFHIIVKSLGTSNCLFNELRNIYCKAMQAEIIKTPEFVECMLKFGFLSFGAIQETISEVKKQLLLCEDDVKMAELLNKLEEHCRLVEEAEMMNEPKIASPQKRRICSTKTNSNLRNSSRKEQLDSVEELIATGEEEASHSTCSPRRTCEKEDILVQKKNLMPSNGCESTFRVEKISTLPEIVNQMHTEECSPRKIRCVQEESMIPNKNSNGVSAPSTPTKVIDRLTDSQSFRSSPRNKFFAKQEPISRIGVSIERNGSAILEEAIDPLTLSPPVRSSPRKRPPVKEEITPNGVCKHLLVKEELTATNELLVETNMPSTFVEGTDPLSISPLVRSSPRLKMSIKKEPTCPSRYFIEMDTPSLNSFLPVVQCDSRDLFSVKDEQIIPNGVSTEMNTSSTSIEAIDQLNIPVQNGHNGVPLRKEPSTPSKVSFEGSLMLTPTKAMDRQNSAQHVRRTPRKMPSFRTPTKSNSQFLSPPTTPNENGLHEATSILATPLDTMSEFNTTPPSTGKSNSTSIVNKSGSSRSSFLMGLRENASTKKRPQSAQQKRKLDLIKFLTDDFFKDLLACPTKYPFHEVLLYDDIDNVKNYTSVNQKGRIEKALQDPETILKCKCCKLRTPDDFPDSWPDLCTVYRLYTEFPGEINLSKWLEAFDSKVSGWQQDQEVTSEVYNRFRQAVRELQLMGFVEPHSRKPDFMKKVDFIKGSRK